MDKYLEEISIANNYWIRQLKDVDINFIDSLNITTYNYKNQNNETHIYPDINCDLCKKLKNIVIEYFSSDYNEQLKLLEELKDYKINGHDINNDLLFELNKINNNINNLNMKKMECKTCNIINNLCDSYYASNDDIEKQKIITKLKKYEMNGYELLHFREHNGYPLQDIKAITHYLFENEDEDHIKSIQRIDPFIDKNISLDKSRWCKRCGARKPNEISK